MIELANELSTPPLFVKSDVRESIATWCVGFWA
jgi:hypothetical protein